PGWADVAFHLQAARPTVRPIRCSCAACVANCSRRIREQATQASQLREAYGMKPVLPRFSTLRSLPRDGRVLFVTRFARMFGYGFLSVVLFLYLKYALDMSDARIGLLLTLTLAGDTVISLALATRADRFGRRKTLT